MTDNMHTWFVILQCCVWDVMVLDSLVIVVYGIGFIGTIHYSNTGLAVCNDVIDVCWSADQAGIDVFGKTLFLTTN